MAGFDSDWQIAERRQWPAVQRFRSLLREHKWAVIGSLWLVAYVLGCVGAAKQFAAAGERRSASDPYYRALQLFIMDDGMVTNGPLVCWELEVARFLAPAVAASAAVAAFLALFRDQVQMFRLRYFRQHVVICGLGRKGLVLAGDFRRHGERVVVVERDEADKGLATCRQLGILVLVGDAAERAVLEKARVATARYVIALCREDGTNAEIALRTYQILQDHRRRPQDTVRGFVHMIELKLCDLFSRHQIFADFGDCFEATLFNIYQNSARMLFEDHPPDRGVIVAGDQRTAHVIVLGFGRMGEAIAVQLARTGHYASGRKPRLTVIDTEAETRRKHFYGRYPQFEQACAAEFHAGDAEDPAVFDRVQQWAGDRGTVATVVVALDNEPRALSCALSLLDRLAQCAVPVVVRMSDEAGLATLLDSEEVRARSLARLHPFGMPSWACTRKMLLNDELDVLAKAIHASYVEQCRRAGLAADASTLLPWEQLDPGLKDSNRQQADHLRVKLRAIGCQTSGHQPPGKGPYGAQVKPPAIRPAGFGCEQAGEPVREFRDDEVELLARMEHARWTAERFLAGWRLGPKNVQARTSPDLIDWQELPEQSKEHNRAAVRQIPRLLELIGERIYRGRETA